MDIETADLSVETEPTTETEGTKAGMSAGGHLKLEVARDELVAKLGIVSRAVSTRGTVQVLSGILLAADGGTITLAATDMELSLRTTLDAEVEGEGAVVIPGQAVRRAGAPPAGERGHARVQARRGHDPDRLGVVQLAPARLQRGGLPAPAGGRRSAARDRSRGIARDRRPGRQIGVPRRVAAGSDGDPRSLRGGQVDHGRD